MVQANGIDIDIDTASDSATARAARNWFRGAHSAMSGASDISPEVRATIARRDALGHHARRWADGLYGCTCRAMDCPVAANAEQLVGERTSDEALPSDPRARLLWRDAMTVQQRHRPDEDGRCVQCGEPSPCVARATASRAMSVATAEPPPFPAVEDEPEPDPNAGIFDLTATGSEGGVDAGDAGSEVPSGRHSVSEHSPASAADRSSDDTDQHRVLGNPGT
jgi:hypothetical protein